MGYMHAENLYRPTVPIVSSASKLFPGRKRWPCKAVQNADDIFERCDRSGGPDACWPWLAAKTLEGAGQIWFRGRARYATRILWYFLYSKELPSKIFICHTCDNPTCVNPKHLFEGTAADNNRDMVRKHRHGAAVHPEKFSNPFWLHQNTDWRGAKNPAAKLTSRSVVKIRKRLRNGEPGRAIARDYGVCESTISNIKLGNKWAHLK